MKEKNGLLVPSPPGMSPDHRRLRLNRGRGILCRIKGPRRPRLHRRHPARKLGGVVIGRLIAIDDSGMLLIDYPGNPGKGSLPARSMVGLTREEVGREVVLMFERGDSQRPIILG